MCSSKQKLLTYDKIVLLSKKKYSKKWYIYTVNTFVLVIQVIEKVVKKIVKRYSQSKIWKKPNDIASFFTFFTTLDIIYPKFFPKTTPDLILFAGF